MKRSSVVLASCAMLVLVLVLGACDSGGDDGEEERLAPGTFTASVSGDIAVEHEGEALYAITSEDAVAPGGSEDAFTIGMIDANAQDTSILVLTRPGAEVPEPGTYSVVSFTDFFPGETPDGFIAAYFAQRGSAFFFFNGGEIDIASAEDDQLAGTFTLEDGTVFPLFNEEPEDDRTVQMEGQFNASLIEEDETPPEVLRGPMARMLRSQVTLRSSGHVPPKKSSTKALR